MLLKSNIDKKRAVVIRSRRGTPSNVNKIILLSNIKNADEILTMRPEDISPITTPHSPNSGINSNIKTTEVLAPINPGHKSVLVFILACATNAMIPDKTLKNSKIAPHATYLAADWYIGPTKICVNSLAK